MTLVELTSEFMDILISRQSPQSSPGVDNSLCAYWSTATDNLYQAKQQH